MKAPRCIPDAAPTRSPRGIEKLYSQAPENTKQVRATLVNAAPQ